jgi:cytidine deaminase
MKEKLLQQLNNAYAPYSNYKVAALVLLKDGTTYSGVNVENASYGATICAERNAINNAIKDGYRKGDFKELYVMVEGDLAFPCFICRQTINEFFELDSKLILMNSNEEKIYSMSEILVHPFGPEDLV